MSHIINGDDVDTIDGMYAYLCKQGLPSNQLSMLTKLYREATEFEETLCADCQDTGLLHSRTEPNYLCTCITETKAYVQIENEFQKINDIVLAIAVEATCTEDYIKALGKVKRVIDRRIR